MFPKYKFTGLYLENYTEFGLVVRGGRFYFYLNQQLVKIIPSATYNLYLGFLNKLLCKRKRTLYGLKNLHVVTKRYKVL